VLSACFTDLGRLSEPNVGLMTDTVSTPTGADGLLTLQTDHSGLIFERLQRVAM
jgi:hypothetical protein